MHPHIESTRGCYFNHKQIIWLDCFSCILVSVVVNSRVLHTAIWMYPAFRFLFVLFWKYIKIGVHCKNEAHWLIHFCIFWGETEIRYTSQYIKLLSFYCVRDVIQVTFFTLHWSLLQISLQVKYSIRYLICVDLLQCNNNSYMLN